jgi:hypothetical protein
MHIMQLCLAYNSNSLKSEVKNVDAITMLAFSFETVQQKLHGTESFFFSRSWCYLGDYRSNINNGKGEGHVLILLQFFGTFCTKMKIKFQWQKS